MLKDRKLGTGMMAALFVGACGEGSGQPAFNTTARVILEDILVVGGCDDDLLIPGPGGYAYRINVRNGPAGTTQTLETSGYGSALGEHKTAAKGARIALNRAFTLTEMKREDQVQVRFLAIEWDFLGMDPRMANQVSGLDATYRGGNTSHEIHLGTSSECLLRLNLTVDW